MKGFKSLRVLCILGHSVFKADLNSRLFFYCSLQGFNSTALTIYFFQDELGSGFRVVWNEIGPCANKHEQNIHFVAAAVCIR